MSTLQSIRLAQLSHEISLAKRFSAYQYYGSNIVYPSKAAANIKRVVYGRALKTAKKIYRIDADG